MHGVVRPHVHPKRQSPSPSPSRGRNSPFSPRRPTYSPPVQVRWDSPNRNSWIPEVRKVAVRSSLESPPPSYSATGPTNPSPVEEYFPPPNSIPFPYAEISAQPVGGVGCLVRYTGTAEVKCCLCDKGEQSSASSNGDGYLYKACNCPGTTRLYHRKCLIDEVGRSKRDSCPFCQYKMAELIPKPWMEYLKKPRVASSIPYLDWIIVVLCSLITTAGSAAGIWYCISEAIRRAKLTKREPMFSAPWMIVSAIIILVYWAYSLMTIAAFANRFRRFTVRLIVGEETYDSNNNEEGGDEQTTVSIQDKTTSTHVTPRSIATEGTPYSTPWSGRTNLIQRISCGASVYPTPEQTPTVSMVEVQDDDGAVIEIAL